MGPSGCTPLPPAVWTQACGAGRESQRWGLGASVAPGQEVTQPVRVNDCLVPTRGPGLCDIVLGVFCPLNTKVYFKIHYMLKISDRDFSLSQAFLLFTR